MKYFFYPFYKVIKSGKGPLLDYINIINGSNDLDTLYKVIYDMVDYIYDKRFDTSDGNDGDEELTQIINGTFRNKINANFIKINSDDVLENEDENEKENENHKKNHKIQRISAFEILYDFLEECKNQMNSSDNVLYYLAKANLCLRISECYMHDYNYEQSDWWGHLAIDGLFHGKIVATNKRDELIKNNADFENQELINLYVRLLKLNLAKYYRDYALKNRRSDFEAAWNEFNHISEKIAGKKDGESLDKTADIYSTLNNEVIKRQYCLIFMDMVIDKIYILRHKYEIKKAEKCIWILYDILVSNCETTNDYKSQIENTCQNIGIKKYKPQYCASESDYPEDFPKRNLIEEGLKYLKKYDKERYILLTMLEISKITKSLHTQENYKKSIVFAIMADKWSKMMDNHNGIEQHNIDAINILSTSLRKYNKFKYDDYNEIEKQILYLLLQDNEQLDSGNKLIEIILRILINHSDKGIVRSKTELIKWYCLSLELQNQELSSMIVKKIGLSNSKSVKEVIDAYTKEHTKEDDSENQNLQLLFLYGFLLVRQKRYKEAVETFNEIINNHKEANYIRMGTIGLKARYLRAKCYIALLQFREAKKELSYLKDTLSIALNGQESDGETNQLDLRIEIDLGYCHIQRSEYEKAINIYENIYMHEEKDTNDYFKEEVVDQLKPSSYIMGLNNFACCLILGKRNEYSTVNAVFEQIKKYSDKNEEDRETNYLKGLYCLKFGMDPDCYNDEDKSKGVQINMPKKNTYETCLLAHKYFKIACGFDQGFIYGHYLNHSSNNQYIVSNHNLGDKASAKNDVARVSAYIINLCNLYYFCDEKENEKKGYRSSIQRFILGLPSACKLSLKAATALANWILEYKEKSKNTSKEKELCNQLLRSFSYIGIYEERGARAFNELKYNAKFRSFSAYDRGEFLAYLLKLYKPIKEIKEECCLKEEQCLVHYTKMGTLKILLDKEKKSPMRINNCGYMNDIFEGTVFINSIKTIYIEKINKGENGSATNKNLSIYKQFISKYFPQTQRQSDNMIPIGSNIYIMSLSDNKDSFPMWSIYSENESGCNIEFPVDFFDVLGKLTEDETLKPYLMSNYKDTDYPVYKVQYLKDNQDNSLKNNKSFTDMIDEWEKLDEYITNNWGNKTEINVIYEFIADRLNEIRFLFKDSNYEYENEYRIVYTAKQYMDKQKQEESIDNSTVHPRVYVNLNRRIENINVRLGSKISDHSVDKYVTWLMHTGRVTKVNLSERNRYTNEVK